MRIDIPSKLLLDLRNGHNIAKLVAWNHEEIQNGAYLVAIPCQPYRIDGKRIPQLERYIIMQN